MYVSLYLKLYIAFRDEFQLSVYCEMWLKCEFRSVFLEVFIANYLNFNKKELSCSRKLPLLFLLHHLHNLPYLLTILKNTSN